MKLPNLENAHIPRTKITEYLLNTEHPEGRGKATFFTQFGFSVAQWEALADALMAHASLYDVTKVEQNRFGTRYVIEGEVNTPSGRSPNLRSVWFIEAASQIPRLVTAYPLEGTDD